MANTTNLAKPTARQSTAASAAGGEDSATEHDILRTDEERRCAVLAKLVPAIVRATGEWRGCRPACRRHRTCGHPLDCIRMRNRKPRSPEQEAAALARLRRDIATHRAALEAAGK